MRELALFAGVGGGILGGKLLGWQTVCAVELNEYCRRVLMQRQDDGILEPFPIWGDIRTFDGRPWAGLVDVVSGGFPCTDISVAGHGAGIDGEHSGLWSAMARVIREVGPRFVLVENSPALTSRGLDRVLGDLAGIGYDARWGMCSAAAVGAAHIRERIWILANSRRELRPAHGQAVHGCENVLLKGGCGITRKWSEDRELAPLVPGVHPRAPENRWRAQSRMDRTAHGVPDWMDRLTALGNGQYPDVVYHVWKLLGGPLT